MTITHDAFAKKVLSDPVIFGELVSQLCPPGLVRHLKIGSLKLLPSEHISPEMQRLLPDLSFSCRWGDGRLARLDFLLENKTHVPRFPQIQLLEYQSARWAETDLKARNLLPIIPIILYHGPRKWGKRPFLDYFGQIPVEFEPFLPQSDYILIDLSTYSDAQIMGLKQSKLVNSLMVMKHGFDQDYLVQFPENIFMFPVEHESTEEGRAFLMSLFQYFCDRIRLESTVKKETVITKIAEIMKPAGGTLLDYIEEKFSAIGMEKGMEKGAQMNLIKNINGMIREFPEASDARIALACTCSVELVRRIRTESTLN